QGGHGDGGPAIGRQGLAAHRGAHDAAVVGDGGGDRLQGGPERALPQAGQYLGRHPDRAGYEQLNRVAGTARGHGRVQSLDVVGRQRRAAVVDHERRLEQREPRDRQPGRGGIQGQDRAGGEAADERRLAGLVDQGGDVLDLALHRVRGSVAALPAAPAVVGVRPEVVPQQRAHLRGNRRRGPVRRRAVDHDQRRPVAPGVEADSRAVRGKYRAHRDPLVPLPSSPYWYWTVPYSFRTVLYSTNRR